MAKGNKRKGEREKIADAATSTEAKSSDGSPSNAAPSASSNGSDTASSASEPARGASTTSTTPSTAAPATPNALTAALRIWFTAYRVEVILFCVTFVVLAGF